MVLAFVKNKSSLLYHLRQLSFCKFYIADKPFTKALRSLETSVLVNNNLCNFIVRIVPSFNPGFNLLSCKLNNFAFKVFYQVILYLILY